KKLALSLAGSALLGIAAFDDVYAQAPTPTFKISGLIDNAASYVRNMSFSDFNLARNNDAIFAGRTRGRLDFIGEYGKVKAVVGIEIDSYWGQTGSTDSNDGPGCSVASNSTVACGTQGQGAESAFDLNTDTQANLQIKWTYVEFEAPLVPFPTVVRLGGQ